MSNFESDLSIATKLVHAGHNAAQWSHLALVPPIVLATTFEQPVPNNLSPYFYNVGAIELRTAHFATCQSFTLKNFYNEYLEGVYQFGRVKLGNFDLKRKTREINIIANCTKQLVRMIVGECKAT